MQRSKEWTLHFDQNYQSYYWYNEATGVSEWATEEQQEGINDHNNLNTSENEKIVELSDVQVRPKNVKSKISKKKHSKEYIRSEYNADIENNITNRDKGNQVANSTIQHNRDSDKDSNEKEDFDNEDDNNDDDYHQNIKVKNDNYWFIVSVYIHAIIIESPLCIAECIARSFAMLLLAALTPVIHRSIPRVYFPWTTNQCLIESLKCLVASLSFAVPGLILLVYRGFSTTEYMELRPIATLIGWIDVRRFATIAFGSGSYADNIDDFTDGLVGQRLQDSWVSTPILFPRQTVHNMRSFILSSD